jgi:hypothetical protein
MSAESRPLDPDGGGPGHSTGRVEARARPVRRGYQLPIVEELPRRWDPLTDGEIVVRGSD